MAQKTVDTTRMSLKFKNVKMANQVATIKALLFARETVMAETIKNLSGPHYKIGTSGPQTGRMPIPRMTGDLARSLAHQKLSDLLYRIYSDQKIAPYAKFVHDGTKRMKPRRYLYDAVKAKKQAIINRMRNELKIAIRKVGR
jgi:HK97 gp10 family phage protein